MKLKDEVYDVLKWVSIIALPSICVCVTSIMDACGITPETINIVTVVMGSVATCIGTLIGVSSVSYHKDNKEGE